MTRDSPSFPLLSPSSPSPKCLWDVCTPSHPSRPSRLLTPLLINTQPAADVLAPGLPLPAQPPQGSLSDHPGNTNPTLTPPLLDETEPPTRSSTPWLLLRGASSLVMAPPSSPSLSRHEPRDPQGQHSGALPPRPACPGHPQAFPASRRSHVGILLAHAKNLSPVFYNF